MPNLELKNCPFCGADAEISYTRLPEPFSHHEYVVSCSKLGVCFGKHHRNVDTGYTNKDDAIRLWNTRTSPPLTDEMLSNAKVIVFDEWDSALWLCPGVFGSPDSYGARRSDGTNNETMYSFATPQEAFAWIMEGREK